MNAFKEALRGLRQREPRRSIGFGMSKAEKSPAMLVGVTGKAGDLGALAAAGAGLLIVEAKDGAAAATAIGKIGADAIKGARVDTLDVAGREAFEGAGGAFIVSSPESTAAAAITGEDCGNVATVSLDADEATLKAFGAIEVDALLVDEAVGELTLARQARIVRAAMLAGKPLLFHVDADVTGGDLRVLRDSGVAGVILAASAGAAAVTRIVDILKEMPPRQESERDERRIAIVPGLAGTHHDHHDGDDD